MGARRWTCPPCQQGEHAACWVDALLGPVPARKSRICDCPCEPLPLPGFPNDQPVWPSRDVDEWADRYATEHGGQW